tara:strand:- start:179 stop:454 length:276 start_codon:yes stop_codon:yes gene_type:complete
MAWNKWNKAPTKRPPHHKWTEEEMKMVAFVMNKGIKIAMTPDWNHEFKHWQIDIKVKNGKWHTDPKRYDDNEVFESLIKYYKYYYDKYNIQ